MHTSVRRLINPLIVAPVQLPKVYPQTPVLGLLARKLAGSLPELTSPILPSKHGARLMDWTFATRTLRVHGLGLRAWSFKLGFPEFRCTIPKVK